MPIHESETTIGALLSAGDFDAATTLTIRVYGPELLGFLRARLGNLDAAREAFAWFAEDLWRGMSRFRRECSMRTWAYALARSAAVRYGRSVQRGLNAVPISQMSRASALAVQLPTTSGPSTEDERRLVSLRERLDEEEQLILSLRVDKNMPWEDVALVTLFEGERPSDDELAREIARLRKRFQYLKQKLRRWLAQAG